MVKSFFSCHIHSPLIKFSLTGLAIRLTDKISRLKNLLVNGKNYVKGEGMEDTFIDIANYGIIGLLVGRDKWKK